MCQNGCPNRGGTKTDFRCFFDFFLIGPPLGAHGFIFLDFWAPRASFWHLFGRPGHHFGTLGAHQNDAPAVQNSMKMNPQTDLTAARWRGWANGQMDIMYIILCTVCVAVIAYATKKTLSIDINPD